VYAIVDKIQNFANGLSSDVSAGEVANCDQILRIERGLN